MTITEYAKQEAKIDDAMNKIIYPCIMNVLEVTKDIENILQDYPEDIRKIVSPILAAGVEGQIDGIAEFMKATLKKSFITN